MHSNKHSRICVDVNNISPAFNPDEFKAQQRQMWNNAAAGWQDWWETIERGARKVMPNGRIVAIDISPQMLAIAKTRAASLGLDGIMEFRESDGEKLDLLDQTAKFDAVLSRFGLMFFPSLPSALVKIRHLLITNGRLSAAVWSTPSKVPLIDLAFASVRKQVNAPAPPPRTPGPFALADAEALKQLFSQAGFKDIKVDTF